MADITLEGYVTYVGVQEVISQIHSGITSAMNSLVRKAAKDILHDILEKEYPSGHYTKYYESTGEMADTVQVTEVQSGTSVVQFKVYIDSTRLNMLFQPIKLNAHASVDGSDFRERLVEILDTGSPHRSPIYTNTGSNYMDKGFSKMEIDLPNTLALGLRASGFPVVMG